ncbi:MAG: NAD(P)H-binding protein [Bacteroidia bacterium]|jgi:putative NADH-flavin reductase|nr:NAD(P)H-binding protein [Bacteroidia bacterium]
MKTIALFGASGKTGKIYLQKALAQGYQVKALVRNPESLNPHPNLLSIKGDILNAEDVTKTIDGAAIVVSLFGRVKDSPKWLQTNGTKNIVSAIRNKPVPVISLSGGGLPFRLDEPKWVDKLIRGIMKLLVGHLLEDAAGHAAVLQNSNLDWTIVRAGRLTLKPEKGNYRIGWVGVNSGTQIGREDLASFILGQTKNFTYNKQMPFISY